MAAKTNLTTAAQITVNAREVDFVTRFGKNWDALRTIMGIMRPIRKAPGTKLVSYEASVDGTLAGGTSVAEGDEIPLTKMKVEPKTYGDIEIAKYAKSVSVEAVAKYGADVAVVPRMEFVTRCFSWGILVENRWLYCEMLAMLKNYGCMN